MTEKLVLVLLRSHEFVTPPCLYYCLWEVINMSFDCPLVE